MQFVWAQERGGDGQPSPGSCGKRKWGGVQSRIGDRMAAQTVLEDQSAQGGAQFRAEVLDSPSLAPNDPVTSEIQHYYRFKCACHRWVLTRMLETDRQAHSRHKTKPTHSKAWQSHAEMGGTLTILPQQEETFVGCGRGTGPQVCRYAGTNTSFWNSNQQELCCPCPCFTPSGPSSSFLILLFLPSLKSFLNSIFLEI